MRFILITAIFLFGTAGAATAGATDPMTSLRYLAGTWSCDYQAGSQSVKYKAVFANSMSGNWIQERDSGPGGVTGEASVTFDPKARTWITVVLGSDRSTTIFAGKSNNANHIVYRSGYPDATMTDVFDRVSPVKYTLHFSQTVRGKTTTSVDTCTKV